MARARSSGAGPKRPRPRRSTRPRGEDAPLIRGASVALLAATGLAIAALVYVVVVYPSRPAGAAGDDVSVALEPGMAWDAVVERLTAAGVVDRPWLFALYGRLIGADEHLRVGERVVARGATARELVQRLSTGFGSAEVEVTIPEGFDRFDIASRLARLGVCEREAFLRATGDRALLDRLEIPGPTAEGYLFPDTYRVREGLDAEEVIRRMVGNHRRRTAPLFEEHGAALAGLRRALGWGTHEVLVLASIVEKEAAVRDEQATIAGVFLNRLRDPGFTPHRLDADPTVSYGCRERPDDAPSCDEFHGRISRAMTHDAQNPYNTYRREGLPPGPISNPGLAAMRAVLAPDGHDYYFFVARGGGRHAFSRTMGEHTRVTNRLRETEP